mgnify:CR=1 FL=1
MRIPIKLRLCVNMITTILRSVTLIVITLATLVYVTSYHEYIAAALSFDSSNQLTKRVWFHPAKSHSSRRSAASRPEFLGGTTRYSIFRTPLTPPVQFLNITCPGSDRIWDGGGTTNNWSEAANWCNDQVPPAGAAVRFNATSTKNVNVDVSPSTGRFVVEAGYTGTITVGAGNTLTAGTNGNQFEQFGGTFNAGAGNFTQQVGAVVVSGGTFNGGSGTLTIPSLSLSGGLFDAGSSTHNAGSIVMTGGQIVFTSGTMTITNSFFRSGGTGDFDNGSIVAAGATNMSLDGLYGSVNNLTLNKSDAVGISTVGTVSVLGTLSLIDGIYGGSGTLEARGPVVIASTFGNATSGGGAATVAFRNGSGPRTITLPVGARLPALVIDDAQLLVNTNGLGTVTLDDFTLNAGTVEFESTDLAVIHASNYLQTGGSFSISTGNINWNTGNVTISNGTFNAGFGTVTLGAAQFNLSGGTFTPSTGSNTFGLSLNTSFSQSGGLFAPGAGSIDVNGVFSLSGGTFNAPSGTMNVGYNFTHTAGTFNHNQGTLIFDSSHPAFSHNLPGNPGTGQFHNLVFALATDNASLTLSGDTWVASGDITINNAQTSFGVLRPEGNLTIGPGADGGDAQVRFTGSAAQTFQNNGGINPTGAFTVDKPSGTVTAASDMMLGTSQALNITSGTLYLNDGSDLRAGNVTIGTNGRLVNDTQTTITLGGNLANSGRIDLRGGGSACPGDDLILIRSSVPGTQRNWSGSGAFRLVDVDVQDMAGTAAITAYSSTNSGNNGANISFNSGCPTELSISPASVSLYRFQTQTFAATGGVAPRVFSIVQNASGGSINSSSGLYTAGNTINVTDTVRLTDAFGNIAEATVNVIPGPATRLAFVVQPSDTEAGQQISPPLQVAVQDNAGNTVPNATNPVTLFILDNPGGSTLSGTITRNAINGIATFDDISLNVPGVGYTLNARSDSTGLTGAVSSSFNITGNIIVTNTNDSGTGSLRAAIEAANAAPGTQIIGFNIPGPGPHTIVVTSSLLPPITGTSVVDGTTQPGYAGSPVIDITSPIGRCFELAGEASVIRGLSISSCTEGIRLGGTGRHKVLGNHIGTNTQGTVSSGQMLTGINVFSSSNEIGGSTLGEGNVIAPSHPSFPSYGIRIMSVPFTLIRGNRIGVNVSGTSFLETGIGIELINADNTTIGSGQVSSRNLIAGSIAGIAVNESSFVEIKGNYLGTDSTGETALITGQRTYGILVRGNEIEIGGSGIGEGNLISGFNNCVFVATSSSGETRDVAIKGNRIGTNAKGTGSLGCVQGIHLFGNLMRRVAIGGSLPGEGNLISGNLTGIASSFGMVAMTELEDIEIRGNLIGVDHTGSSPLPNDTGVWISGMGWSPNAVRIGNVGNGSGNTIAHNTRVAVGLSTSARNVLIRGNSIHSNGLGISGPLNLTIDHLDPDLGSNDQQNYPTIASALSGPGSTVINGSLNSRPSRVYAVDLYSTNVCSSPSGFTVWGQGKTYLGSINVPIGSSGISAFTFSIPTQLAEPYVVATATDPDGNTSIFSQCMLVGELPFSIEGTVLDSTGRPVADAVVEMSGDVSRRRRTDANGIYRFLNLPSGGSYSTRVTASGFGISPATRDYPNLDSNQSGQDFTATRGRYSIRGATVNTADGAILPLSGVRMILSGTEARGIVSEGEFQIANLPPGTYTLTPFKGGVLFSPPSADITITDGDIGNIVFTGTIADPLPGRFIAVDPGSLKLKSLHADGTNRGLMVNAAPTARQRVSISRDGRRVLFAKTDSSGRKLPQIFTAGTDGASETGLTDEGDCELPFEWSPDGTKILFGLCDGSARQEPIGEIWVMNADGSERQMIDLNGQRNLSGASWIDGDSILFVAATGSQGTGADLVTMNIDGTGVNRITDDSAQERDPIVSPDGSRAAYYVRIVEPSGRLRAAYRVRHLQTGVVTDIVESYALGKPAWSPLGTHLAVPVRGSSSTASTVLRVYRLSDMSQQVVDEDGSAWFAWGPSLSLQTQTGTNVSVASGFVSVTFGGVGSSGTTTISPISPSSAGTAPNGFVLGNLAFEINTTAAYTSPVTVCFNVPNTYATSPIAFSRLALLHNEGGVLVDRTVSRDFGTRIICGSVTTLSPFVLGVEIDASLPAVEGVIVDLHSRPLPNVLVSIYGDENVEVETDVDGRFSFVNLPAGGNFLVQPKKVGYLFADYNVDVIGATGTTNLAFVGTESNFTASGRVVNQNGAGVQGVTMSLIGSLEVNAITAPNGDFAFTDLPADGEFSIQPADPNYPVSPATVDISPLISDATGIEFVFLAPTSAGVSLSGRVVTLDGFGLANAVVTAIDSEGNSRTARTGSFGTYYFEGLEAGKTYVLSVNAKGHTFMARVVTVNEDLFDVDLVSTTAGQVRSP